jgi:hypothetical protein
VSSFSLDEEFPKFGKKKSSEITADWIGEIPLEKSFYVGYAAIKNTEVVGSRKTYKNQ